VGTGVFVQVRLGSTRLPGKALLPLAGSTVIGHVMRALREVPADVHALLTDEASAAELAPAAAAEGFALFAGHPTDVLARFCAACRHFSVTRVVRATGDNPLVCPRLAREILEIHGDRGSDLSHYLGIPWGSGVECVEAAALFRAEGEASDPAEREHITTFHYRRPDRFRIVEEPAPPDAAYAEARVTVDTRDDYERVAEIFRSLYRGVPLEARQIVEWAASRGGRAQHG
jgi:spore coat polysaccharide biosynthesis protein SpsF